MLEIKGLLNPSSDFVFANLFGTEKHKRLLICLLNSILKGKPTIKSITLINPLHKKQRKSGKTTTLDVEAITDDKTIVNIEIQCERNGNLINRAFYHQTRMIKDELDEGESYDSSPNIISIWITDYHATERQHHTHEAVYMFKANRLDGVEVASEKTRVFIIELPKVDLKKATIKDMFMVWMFFIKNPELIPEEFVKKVPEVEEALEELKVMSMNKEFRRAYNAHMKRENDRKNRETNAEIRGKEEGIAIGKEEGMAIGKEEGKIETALSMLADNLPLETISKYTGLSVEDIASLRRRK
jgi:predicted transposase/invertase (TIGR01784 family)